MTFLTDKTLETTRGPIFGVILGATVGAQQAKSETCLKNLTKCIIILFYITFGNEHIGNIIHWLAGVKNYKYQSGDGGD